MDSNDLDSGNPFFKEMKELRNHSKTCRNSTCQKYNWDRTEIFDVVEIGTVGKLQVSDLWDTDRITTMDELKENEITLHVYKDDEKS